MTLNEGFKSNIETSQINNDGDIYLINDLTGVVVKPKWRGTSQDKWTWKRWEDIKFCG